MDLDEPLLSDDAHPNGSSGKQRKSGSERRFEFESHELNKLILLSEGVITPMFVQFTRKDLDVPFKAYRRSKRFVNTPAFKEAYGGMMGENPELSKFFRKCFVLFSQFDKGIKLDPESWFSVTPEHISKHIANRLKSRRVFDGFCGAGGNLIQFALHSGFSYGNDIDPVKIDCVKSDAEVYGVSDNIGMFNEDFLSLDDEIEVDVCFFSPPWGGIDYQNMTRYALFTAVTPNIISIIRKGLSICKNMVLLLPKNTFSCDIVNAIVLGFESETEGKEEPLATWSIEIEGIYSNGELNMLAVYFGDVSCVKHAAEVDALTKTLNISAHSHEASILSSVVSHFGVKKVVEIMKICMKKNTAEFETNTFSCFMKEFYSIYPELSL
eukprot:TRINITY_DN8350_c0_g1_i2.p1 TRINITY_DN8350_c0_g1~~TRINITY_DN8350_c0_g1_i2.p1  ORF type:complete len:381 (+),score=65.71 TRINITY_DN8350_c0_g1_i2:139-1281(+)